MRSTSCLIFDLDGTLIDSSDGIVEAANYSLRMMGQREQSPDAIKRYIGFPLSEMYAEFTTVSPKELYRHFRVKADKTVVSSTVLLPGVEETLERCRELGRRMAIATTKVRSNLDGIIHKFGWESIFEVTLGGDEAKRVKPEPDIIRMALHRLDVRPEEALVIGDTVNDILAARGASVPVAVVRSPYAPPDGMQALQPDQFFESITELPFWLQRQETRSDCIP